MSPRSEYDDRHQPYLSLSSCSWDSSSSLEAMPGNPDASGHVMAKSGTKSDDTFAPRHDYLTPCPTTGPHMRRSYPEAAKVDCSFDCHSEHHYKGLDRFAAFTNCNGQSIECHSEKSNGIFSYPRQWRQQYGANIPSLSSRQGYGEQVPTMSHHWRCRDKIPLYSGQRCHDAEARRLSSYQQGPFRGNRQPRDNFAHGIVSNQQVKMTATRNTGTRPRVSNRVVNSTSTNYRSSRRDNPPRNSEEIRDQVCCPRASKVNSTSTPTAAKKDILSPLVRRDQFNKSDFSIQYEHAKFFMIKSYSEDDIHKGVKYNVWASTPNGNSKLDTAFHDAQILMKEKGAKCPVFLLFSVNTSGQFVGLAEMLGPVDFKKTMDFWQQNKWNGFSPVVWHIVKDIPNRLFKHITLENNDNRPVTFSRDTQEGDIEASMESLNFHEPWD